MNKIATICVHYKNNQQTQAFIEMHDYANSDLIVVDNSNDLEPIKERVELKCVKPSSNLGYFGGVQYGFKEISNENYDFIIVANSDIQFDSNFFSLLNKKSYDKNVGVIAPHINSQISKNNINPLYVKAPSLKKLKRIRWAFEFYPIGALWQAIGYLKGLRGSGINGGVNVETQTEIFAPHGCLMVFTKSYFEIGLDFDYPIFLYGEELWVAQNCKSKSLKIQTDWDLKALHYEHGSLGVIPSYRVWKAHRDSNRFLIKLFS